MLQLLDNTVVATFFLTDRRRSPHCYTGQPHTPALRVAPRCCEPLLTIVDVSVSASKQLLPRHGVAGGADHHVLLQRLHIPTDCRYTVYPAYGRGAIPNTSEGASL